MIGQISFWHICMTYMDHSSSNDELLYLFNSTYLAHLPLKSWSGPKSREITSIYVCLSVRLQYYVNGGTAKTSISYFCSHHI